MIIINNEPSLEDVPDSYWLSLARELLARDDLAAFIVIAVDKENLINITLSTPPGEASEAIYAQMKEFTR